VELLNNNEGWTETPYGGKLRGTNTITVKNKVINEKFEFNSIAQ